MKGKSILAATLAAIALSTSAVALAACGSDDTAPETESAVVSEQSGETSSQTEESGTVSSEEVFEEPISSEESSAASSEASSAVSSAVSTAGQAKYDSPGALLASPEGQSYMDAFQKTMDGQGYDTRLEEEDGHFLLIFQFQETYGQELGAREVFFENTATAMLNAFRSSYVDEGVQMHLLVLDADGTTLMDRTY